MKPCADNTSPSGAGEGSPDFLTIALLEGPDVEAVGLSARSSSDPLPEPSVPDQQISTERKASDELLRLPQVPEVQNGRDELNSRRNTTYRLSHFEIHRTLGTGSFARVYLGKVLFAAVFDEVSQLYSPVRSKTNLRFYVIKSLNKKHLVDQRQIAHAENERRVLQAVNHPLFINLWGTFQDFTSLYMVMDYVPGGELFTLLQRCPSSKICVVLLWAVCVGRG